MSASPVVPWLGGKRRLASQILPLFPPHTCYVEPFAGGAAVFFMKEPSKVEVLNDVDGELVNLYRVIQHHLEEFVRQFRWVLISREHWQKILDLPPESLTDVQRAARFYYLQKLCFGARPTGRTFGTATVCPPRLNLLRFEEDLSAAHLRLSRVTVERLDWADCVDRYDREHTLFFLDPPYWDTAGYGMEFGLDQYEALAERLRSMSGRAILSINDVGEMRRVFAGLPHQAVSTSYTVGKAGLARRPVGELIVRNWS